MKEPRPEATADADERQDPPDFDGLAPPEEVVRGDRTRDDFFDAVLGLRTPATASEVADRADHGVDAAREYLKWFERMGIVTRVSDSPATYERNQEYLNWRRVQRLQEKYTADDLLTRLQTEADRDDKFAEELDAESPDAVAIAARASETGRSVEDVWEDVSAWKTTRRRISLLERALQGDSDGNADERTAV
jgi:hypothetical protein